MSSLLFVQILNGLQLGVLLFLIAAGLTLVFGVMDLINLAHGVQYMLGAYLAVLGLAWTGSFWLGLGLALAGSFASGLVLDALVFRRLLGRDHLDQVLATYGLILAFVVIVVGGVGSIRGAFVAALLVGLTDALGRTLITDGLRQVLSPSAARMAGPALASMAIYLLMACVLGFMPRGLLPARGR